MRPSPLSLRRQQRRLLLRLLLRQVPNQAPNKVLPKRRPRQRHLGLAEAVAAEDRVAVVLPPDQAVVARVVDRLRRRPQTGAEVVADSRTSTLSRMVTIRSMLAI